MSTYAILSTTTTIRTKTKIPNTPNILRTRT